MNQARMLLIGMFYLSINCLTACNSKHKALAEKIAASDSVAINFFRGDGRMDTVIKVLIVKDSAVIQNLCLQVSNEKLETKADCGVGGSLHFFKYDKVIQDIYFSPIDSNCNRFLFTLNGQQECTRFSDAAKNLLANLGSTQ